MAKPSVKENELESHLTKALTLRRAPAILYHYTSAFALLEILKTHSIWSTNIRFLNDSNEYNLAINIARGVIGEHLEKASNGFQRALWNVLEKRLSSDKQIEVYVTSFTEMPDQLSQWRAYCSPHGGFAIGFLRKQLQRFSAPNYGWLVQCRYERDSQEQLVGMVLKDVANSAEKNLSAGLDQDRIFRESFKLFGRWLPLLASALKDPSFAEEKEWRLVRLSDSFSGTPFYRVGRSTLVPYYEHHLVEAPDSLPIKELVIGPTPHPELAREAIHGLLASKRLGSVWVRSSSVPHRTW